MLVEALENPFNREALIREFQDAVADEPEDTASGTSWDTLTSLATDLEFYVADSELRNDHPSYFGDERLKEEILSTLRALVDQHAIDPALLKRSLD